MKEALTAVKNTYKEDKKEFIGMIIAGIGLTGLIFAIPWAIYLFQ